MNTTRLSHAFIDIGIATLLIGAIVVALMDRLTWPRMIALGYALFLLDAHLLEPLLSGEWRARHE